MERNRIAHALGGKNVYYVGEYDANAKTLGIALRLLGGVNAKMQETQPEQLAHLQAGRNNAAVIVQATKPGDIALATSYRQREKPLPVLLLASNAMEAQAQGSGLPTATLGKIFNGQGALGHKLAIELTNAIEAQPPAQEQQSRVPPKRDPLRPDGTGMGRSNA